MQGILNERARIIREKKLELERAQYSRMVAEAHMQQASYYLPQSIVPDHTPHGSRVTTPRGSAGVAQTHANQNVVTAGASGPLPFNPSSVIPYVVGADLDAQGRVHDPPGGNLQAGYEPNSTLGGSAVGNYGRGLEAYRGSFMPPIASISRPPTGGPWRDTSLTGGYRADIPPAGGNTVRQTGVVRVLSAPQRSAHSIATDSSGSEGGTEEEPQPDEPNVPIEVKVPGQDVVKEILQRLQDKDLPSAD